MVGIPSIKLLLGGGTITLVGAFPNIISSSLRDSKVVLTNKGEDSSKQINFSKSSAFGDNWIYKNGTLSFKNVCFYYAKGSKNKISLVGYATGQGIGSGCHTVESSVKEDQKKLGILRVEIPIDLSTKTPNSKYSVWYLGSESESYENQIVLGCLEVDWWKRVGWRGRQSVVVGDSFKILPVKGVLAVVLKQQPKRLLPVKVLEHVEEHEMLFEQMI